MNNLSLKTLSAAVAVSATFPTLAQNWAIEEVIVTAQKRSESVQDVPVAISAFTNEMVAYTGANEISDLIPMVPGLTGTTTSTSVSSWAIRGISTNDFTIAAEPSVATFIDDAYIGRNQLSTAAFFDVERIEVVKGPQGTLFGRNAVGGAISISANKPSFENNFSLGGYVGNEGQGGLDAMANIALSDTVALRAAYHGIRLEGIYEDLSQDEDAGRESDAARISLLWEPTENLQLLATGNWSDGEIRLLGGAYSPDFQALNDEPGAGSGLWPEQVRQSGEDLEETETNGQSLRITWDINDSLTLTSITDRRSFDYWFTQDLDGSEADDFMAWAFLLAPEGVPEPIPGVGISLQYDQATEQESLYQELRLNGGNDSVDWFLGVSYFNEDLEETINLHLVDVDGYIFEAGPGFRVSDESRGDGETTSYGVYGDVKYHVTDKLSVTGGIRWSRDEKDWCAYGLNLLDFGFVDTNGQTLCDTASWSEITPRLVVDYALSESTMVYASSSAGYKGGGFNTTTTGTQLVDFDPETVQSYEMGVKGSYFDGSLQANVAIYLNDYQDLQILSATTSGIVISNAAEAETRGVEMDITWSVNDNLVFMGNYAYLDAQFKNGEFFSPYGELIDLKGNAMPYAPENTFSLAVAWDILLGAGSVSVFSSYNWTDEFAFSADNAANTTQDAYGLWNAKVTYNAPSEAWNIYLAADNISDEEYANWFQDIGIGSTNVYRGNPRLVKAGFNLYF